MKKKSILICIFCVVLMWVTVGVVDFAMVKAYKKPIFCIGVELQDDGGSGKYVGLGYSFDIEGNFMPEEENQKVTSYRGYLFGVEVVRGFWEEMLPGPDAEFTETTGERETEPDKRVLEEPPDLIVSCQEKTVKAMRGTTSWRYTNEYGRGKGFESDSLHPLNAKEFMTPLKLTPDANPQAGTHTAYLQWETAPDIVIVECWSEECWGHSDAESKEVPVDTLEIDYTDGGYDTDFIIDLENGNYIYSVIAEWNSAENYSGRAYYSFYTEKEDCK